MIVLYFVGDECIGKTRDRVPLKGEGVFLRMGDAHDGPLQRFEVVQVDTELQFNPTNPTWPITRVDVTLKAPIDDADLRQRLADATQIEELRDAITYACAFIQEWDNDGLGCLSCHGLSHHEGCKLRAALDVIHAFTDEGDDDR